VPHEGTLTGRASPPASKITVEVVPDRVVRVGGTAAAGGPVKTILGWPAAEGRAFPGSPAGGKRFVDAGHRTPYGLQRPGPQLATGAPRPVVRQASDRGSACEPARPAGRSAPRCESERRTGRSCRARPYGFVGTDVALRCAPGWPPARRLAVGRRRLCRYSACFRPDAAWQPLLVSYAGSSGGSGRLVVSEIQVCVVDLRGAVGLGGQPTRVCSGGSGGKDARRRQRGSGPSVAAGWRARATNRRSAAWRTSSPVRRGPPLQLTAPRPSAD